MTKLDLKKEPGGLYRASAKDIAEIDVPAFDFLMIDGSGDPNTSASYREAVEAPSAYTLDRTHQIPRPPPPFCPGTGAPTTP